MTATTTSIADATQMLKDLYNDTETRPQKVAEALHTAGLATVLQKAGLNVSADKVVDALASMTTIEGFVEKKNAAKDIAGEYIAKARDTDGRKEIVEEIAATETYQTAKATITEKVVEPVSAKINAGKELAAPYVASAKEMSDPYVAKLAELRKSERVEAMISAFNEAREHPAEKVSELRAKAVDLIKYEKLREYREHVLSAEFHQDTIQLVKVDLPAIAASAAKRGADGVKATATAFKDEMDKLSEKLVSKLPSEVEMKLAANKLKMTGAALLAELQAELSSGVEHVKSEGFSLEDTVGRLKRVVDLVDKMVVTPIVASVKPAESPAESSATEEEYISAEGGEDISAEGGDLADEADEDDEQSTGEAEAPTATPEVSAVSDMPELSDTPEVSDTPDVSATPSEDSIA